jgi:hypothetical protein
MAANRLFYACQALAIAKTGHNSVSATQFEVMKGVQSAGVNTNFTLEQVFEYGQVELYSNEDEVSEVEITVEKVIDGHKLLYLQAVGEIGKTNLVSASNSVSDVYLALYPDTITSVGGVTPDNVMMCSGVTVSSVSYTYPINGNATESITLVGNSKFWNASSYGMASNPTALYGTGGSTATVINGAHTPSGDVGVARRAKFNLATSTIPAEVMSQLNTVGSPGSGLQSVNISADFGREDMLEQGRFGPYFKYATYPFEVTCEFEVNATRGDLIAISGQGVTNPNRSIVIRDTLGTVINLGTKNKLTSVSHSGGDTGGGIATLTYSYSTYNDLRVSNGQTYWS